MCARPFIAVVAAAVLATACAGRPPRREGDMLHAQLNEDWRYWMTQYPEIATSFGYPGQEDRWTDYSQSAIDRRAAFLRQSLALLDALDRSSLSAEDQLNAELYRGMLDSAITGLEFHNDALPIRGVIPHNLLMPVNQLEGVQQDVPRTLAIMRAATPEDYEHIISRLHGVGPLVDQTIALMEQGRSAGMTPPSVTLRDVPGQVKAQIVDDPLKSPLLAAFTNWPATISAADRASLAARATTAYRQVVAPAFERLYRFLESTYLPACRNSTAVTALPGGAAVYGYNVKWHVTTGDTPQKIHEVGLSE